MGQGMMVVPVKSIKIPDMKPNNVFSGILGLLFLASATIHASPDEVQSPSKSGLRVITEPVLAEAAASLVNTYNQSGPYQTILLENAQSGQLAGMIREEGTMALVTGYSPALNEQPDLWRMAVGKEVIIPVMNGRNPEYEAITSHGITLESLANKASGPDGLLMIRGAGVETMVAGFLGVEQSEMQATLLPGTGELLQALEKNPGAIAFARLTDVMALQSLQLAEGLSLVPLDLDGNGTLSPLEDIYRTPSDLVHAIQIGKYPRTLSSKIYVVASQPPQEENQVAFLDWMVQ
jgi:phosphate transport system substrate-binding protein